MSQLFQDYSNQKELSCGKISYKRFRFFLGGVPQHKMFFFTVVSFAAVCHFFVLQLELWGSLY